MKAILLSIMITLAATSLFIIGCEPVDDGSPSNDIRDAYVGEWHMVESFKSSLAQSYIITISKDPNNSSQVIIGNFGNPGLQNITVKGLVTSGQIVISSQTMSNKWVIEGAGSFSNVAKTTMSWTYTLTAGGNMDDYTAMATLQ